MLSECNRRNELREIQNDPGSLSSTLKLLVHGKHLIFMLQHKEMCRVLTRTSPQEEKLIVLSYTEKGRGGRSVCVHTQGITADANSSSDHQTTCFHSSNFPLKCLTTATLGYSEILHAA